jgi:hypothetical protein
VAVVSPPWHVAHTWPGRPGPTSGPTALDAAVGSLCTCADGWARRRLVHAWSQALKRPISGGFADPGCSTLSHLSSQNGFVRSGAAGLAGSSSRRATMTLQVPSGETTVKPPTVMSVHASRATRGEPMDPDWTRRFDALTVAKGFGMSALLAGTGGVTYMALSSPTGPAGVQPGATVTPTVSSSARAVEYRGPREGSPHQAVPAPAGPGMVPTLGVLPAGGTPSVALSQWRHQGRDPVGQTPTALDPSTTPPSPTTAPPHDTAALADHSTTDDRDYGTVTSKAPPRGCSVMLGDACLPREPTLSACRLATTPSQPLCA